MSRTPRECYPLAFRRQRLRRLVAVVYMSSALRQVSDPSAGASSTAHLHPLTKLPLAVEYPRNALESPRVVT